MTRFLFLLALLAILPARAEEGAPLPGGTCLACHSRIKDKVAELWKEDVHAQAGLSCADCHGGNPKIDSNIEAKLPSAGFKGKIRRADIPKLCGGCHSDATFMKGHNPLLPVDQLQKYWTSVHGKKLMQGDTKVAQCASCHGAHGIRKVSDPKAPVFAANLPKMCSHCHADSDYMADYHISTKQYEDYVESVHGKDLLEKGDVRGAPACNDCHGNHGAAPPTLASISHICGTCHSHNAELFLSSPMGEGFRKKSLADCIACHGKHKILHTSDDWIGDRQDSLCRNCHKENDPGSQLARYLEGAFTGIHKEHAQVEKILAEARLKGMDVLEGEDALQEARQALIQTRTIVHSFTKATIAAKVEEVHKSQRAAMAVGLHALDENRMRRKGLAVSTLFLMFVTLGVAVKIRSLKRRG